MGVFLGAQVKVLLSATLRAVLRSAGLVGAGAMLQVLGSAQSLCCCLQKLLVLEKVL